MNTAEKIAGAYLRLNGFLTLSHFTVFDGDRHNHIDFVALRAPNSKENIGDTTFPTDDLLFQAIGSDSRSRLLGVAAEVRTNTNRDSLSDAHISYVGRFLGEIPLQRVVFYKNDKNVTREAQTLAIDMRYASLWILQRIDWMNTNKLKLSKSGSWNLSEDFLSDLLVLHGYGLLTRKRNAAAKKSTPREDSK